MSIFVEREELEEFLSTGGRKLLYGRRKTGKTFYARRKLRDYEYYIVRRGGLFYNPESQEEYSAHAFIKICSKADNVIIDEFHRAPMVLHDAIQAGECPSDLLLITSTLHYYTRYTQARDAPLKGLFLAHKVGLISPLDLVRHKWRWKEPGLYERLVYYQEPTLIGRELGDIMLYSAEAAWSLVGEVLAEEDYQATRRYHYILQAISAGKTRLTEISSYLYSRGLIPTQSPAHITKYIEAMTRIGLIEKIPVWGSKKKTIYRHVSPLTHTAYYLEAKFGITDYPVSRKQILQAAESLIPSLIEVFIERLVTSDCGGRPVKILKPETDIAIASRNKLLIAAEVKWRNQVRREELAKAQENLSQVNAETKLIITKKKPQWSTKIPIVTLGELVENIKANPNCKWTRNLKAETERA